MSAMRPEVPRQAEQAPVGVSEQGQDPESDQAEVLSPDTLELDEAARRAEDLAAIVIAHRKALVDAGICEEAADEMAVGLHEAMVDDWVK